MHENEMKKYLSTIDQILKIWISSTTFQVKNK
jgi:hypothetical protein